jgi:hypothetical protein
MPPSRRVETVSWAPRAFVYHNFMSDEECQHIIAKAAPHVRPGELCTPDCSHDICTHLPERPCMDLMLHTSHTSHARCTTSSVPLPAHWIHHVVPSRPGQRQVNSGAVADEAVNSGGRGWSECGGPCTHQLWNLRAVSRTSGSITLLVLYNTNNARLACVQAYNLPCAALRCTCCAVLCCARCIHQPTMLAALGAALLSGTGWPPLSGTVLLPSMHAPCAEQCGGVPSRRRADPVIEAVQMRVATWTHLPMVHQEDMQVLYCPL